MLPHDLQSLKYAELQKLAKNAGIRANQKIEKLVHALREHHGAVNSDAEKLTEEEPATAGQDMVDPKSKLSPRTGNAPGSANKENKGKKRRRTFELEEPTLKGNVTPVIENEPRTRLQISRNNTPQEDTENPPFVKRLRRSTFDKQSSADVTSSIPQSSPSSTKAIINSIEGDCSSAERKEKILSAINKKVQQKMIASPVNPPKNQTSQIPRFMAFLIKKKEGQSTTPGSKKWDRVHKKEFSKFDSIDVYLEKKQQRQEILSNSTKKRLAKSPAVKPSSKIVKPLSKETDLSKAFQPTVMSTKNINFDFTSTVSKTPKSKIAATSMLSKTPKSKIGANINTPCKKNGLISSKNAVSTNRATPFKFTGNTTLLNSTSSKKPSFDLKASLARPLTWKPHTGKLRVDCNTTHNVTNQKPAIVSSAKQNISIHKSGNVTARNKAQRAFRRDSTDKMRPVQAKNIRRAAHLDRRNNQKYVDMMRRRGLMA